MNHTPTVWRTKLRSTLPHVDHTNQVQHCLDRGLIGIGWRMDEASADTPLETVLEWIEAETAPGWGANAAHNVRRLGEVAKEGDFVWTRDTSGRYWLCTITGPYRYDGSDAAKAVDVHQVRDVRWAPRPLNDLDVPGKVIACFTGQGASFSRVGGDATPQLTAYLWAKLNDEPLPKLELTARQVLTQHLDWRDVEDLVFLWLQVVRGYLALPRARAKDTPAYEFTMLHPQTKRRGIVQVKTGATPVDIAALANARADNETDTFAYATSGDYQGDPSQITHVIDDQELLDMVAERPEVLPGRTRAWFELATLEDPPVER